jgi:phytoene dehydrogenase-like protein
VPSQFSYDAVIVGSGPNGLAAAVRLAQEKLSVLVLEAEPTIGGGVRSAEITLPGFTHDICSAIHPLGVGSPFFRKLPLEKHGLRWIQPDLPLAHPLPDGSAALLCRSVEDTATGLGSDAAAYRNLFATLSKHWDALVDEILRPFLHWPKHPWLMASFGFGGLQSASAAIKSRFSGEAASALFAGLAAHSFLPLEQRPSAAFGMILGMLGHGVGWPLPKGGSQRIADALASLLRSMGGEIRTGVRIESAEQLPLARATLFDVTPRQLLRIFGDRLPGSYRNRLERFRYGPGVFKVDYALNAPIPWRSVKCARAGTVHICGTWEEVALSEREVSQGKEPERPFVLLAQPSIFDSTRAPAGEHTAWAYCHVPHGSTVDMSERIEKQIERFAPGFRDCVLVRHRMNTAHMEQHNANLVGGDINGGLADLRQLVARPVLGRRPYRTALPGIYLCSSSTPPGGGVHGMCGFHAAQAALNDVFGKSG